MTYEDYLHLVEEIRNHDIHYYIECKPIISDYEYDQLYKTLEKIEKQHPDWVVHSSPTQKVQEGNSKGFAEVKHRTPMLSLANTYSEEELIDFMNRVKKGLGHHNISYSVELKMDGIAISLQYENGFFVRGVTRGNGEVGDDVTSNLKTIRELPLKLKGHVPDFLEIRAEVFMPLFIFQKLNQEKELKGEDVYANPRNAAAGSLKLLDAKQVYARGLSLVCYGIEGDPSITSQEQVHEHLKKWGLPTFEKENHAMVSSIEELMHFADKILKKRHSLPFEIDGIVVKLNDLKDREYLGFTAKTPRWAVAYKFAPEQAVTFIEDIVVQVGRTGVLTPVAQLKPVFLSGSTIMRATLHNLEEIKRKDIRIHDTVTIEKGGDVIPKVVSVDTTKRPGDSKPWHMPKQCPMCGAAVVHFEEEVAYRCPNKTSCPGQQLQKIIFFASKKAFDIEHLGEKNIEKFSQMGFINRFPDIFRLTYQDLEQVEGFKEKSINNLLTAIEKAKECPLDRFILALGIKNVGEETAYLLAKKFKTIENLIKADEEALTRIEGIGPVVAQSILEYFKDEDSLQDIRDLLSLGVKPLSLHASAHQTFDGKTFVLTGTLKNYSRADATKLIRDRGGNVSSSVSKKVDYVVVGEEAGSKLQEAKKHGVAILSEEEFTNLLKA